MRYYLLFFLSLILIACKEPNLEKSNNNLTFEQRGELLAENNISDLKVSFDKFQLGKTVQLEKREKLLKDENNVSFVKFLPAYFNTGRIYFGESGRITKIEVIRLVSRKISAKYSSYMFTILDSLENKFGKADYTNYGKSVVYYKRFVTKEEFVKRYVGLREENPRKTEKDIGKKLIYQMKVHPVLRSVHVSANKHVITVSYYTHEF